MKRCEFDDCDAPLRIRQATEMPTMLFADVPFKVTWTVKYCDAGHVLNYEQVAR